MGMKNERRLSLERDPLVDLGLRQYLSEGRYIWDPNFLDKLRQVLRRYNKPLVAVDLDGVLRKDTKKGNLLEI